MAPLLDDAGSAAPLLICFLLFIEEAGVPLPLFPGDLLLVVFGVLLIGDHVSRLWIPVAYTAALGGAAAGFWWSGRLGEIALRRIAARVHLLGPVERASALLRRSGPLGIAVARLVPGTRVYTTLVAGAAQVPPRSYAAGLVLSTTVWMSVLIGLGAAVGMPIEAHLRALDSACWSLAPTLFSVLGLILCLRTAGHKPSGRGVERMALAAAIDLGLLLALADTEPARWLAAALPHQIMGLGAVGGGLAVAYVAALRLLSGATVGERLADVGYGRPRRRERGAARTRVRDLVP